ncbi:MAG TPA: phosphatase PAP2 family protein [Vicinamibacterales bacterium]|nr:phosphatase PAP2 family protein [Vicinamibacterales bacterium]
MRLPVAAALVVALAGTPAAAQTIDPRVGDLPVPEASGSQQGLPDWSSRASSGGSFFGAVKNDFKTFFTSTDTAWTMGILGGAAVAATKWDKPVAVEAHEDLSASTFHPGSIAGNFMVQMAGAGGTYFFGRATGNTKVAQLGGDLMRAQILSQAVVQGAKFATGRSRPDASNDKSFPSGHTASAFAMATVIQRDLGWKAGIPAFAVAGYIGASRMQANKHYLSDVLIGAGVGIAAAHAVTVHVGHQKLAMGVEPTVGGAAITFTKR